MVKLGTNVQEIIDHCGGVTGEDIVLKMGGPMMGAPISDTNVPIIKGSNGIIAIAADHTEEKECIKCGRCVDAVSYTHLAGPRREEVSDRTR